VRRYPVHSSNLVTVGYNSATRKAEIEFTSGKTYEYEGVEPEQIALLLFAPSVGRQFHAGLRKSRNYREVNQIATRKAGDFIFASPAKQSIIAGWTRLSGEVTRQGYAADIAKEAVENKIDVTAHDVARALDEIVFLAEPAEVA